MKILIKNARIVDPANNIDDRRDVLIKGAKIYKLARNIKETADTVIDARDKIVMPGLVDMHVHLREPGREDKETVSSGTRAALRGGITSVLAMPNTSPAIDSPERVRLLKQIVNRDACVNVYICGAITQERAGSKLVDIKALKKAGAVAISDDGASVDDEALFAQALKAADSEEILVISHCEDKTLSLGGVVNLGLTSTRMGLRGISRESEYKRVARDIATAQKLKARLHVAHVSCKESVELIAKAKDKGARITCETAPHYFSFTEEAAWGFDANMKMNPPLRGRQDLATVKEGLSRGTIDAIASDHAPHTENEKDIEFERAESGVIGLETELAASITALVAQGVLDWAGLAKKLSLNPAKILGLDKGTLGEGKDADVVVISMDKEWLVQKSDFFSRSKNSAFLGKKLKGLVEYTICAGKIAYKYQ